MAGFISVADRVGLRPRLGFTDRSVRFVRNTFLPLLGIGAMLFSPSGCGHRTEKPIDTTQTNLWLSSGPWANDDHMFNCGWDPSNAVNNNGKITLALNDTPGSGRPFSSGEYRTQGFYGYGTIEASIRAANGSGLITSLFTCTGPYDNGNPHDEIDWEIFGKDPRTAQTNYFTNGRGGHEQVIHLGFDASTGFHKYTIVWKPDEIDWLVDGKNVRTVQGSPETLPKTPGRVMANLWPGTGVDGWTGKFTYPGNPITAEYGWIRFIPQSGEAKTSAAAPASSGTNSAPNPAAATARGNLSGISIVTESTFNGATGGSE